MRQSVWTDHVRVPAFLASRTALHGSGTWPRAARRSAPHKLGEPAAQVGEHQHGLLPGVQLPPPRPDRLPGAAGSSPGHEGEGLMRQWQRHGRRAWEPLVVRVDLGRLPHLPGVSQRGAPPRAQTVVAANTGSSNGRSIAQEINSPIRITSRTAPPLLPAFPSHPSSRLVFHR
jgi:hypothetical protein